MAQRPTYPVTRRVAWSIGNSDAFGGVMGTFISAVIAVAGGVIQTNLLGAALSATVSAAGDVLVTGGGGGGGSHPTYFILGF